MSDRSGVQIRTLRPGDLPALLAGAAEAAWGLLTSAERLAAAPGEVASRAAALVSEALARPGTHVIVAEADGALIGYEFLTLRRDEVSGLLEALKFLAWVAPAWRGRGLNRALHEAGEAWSRSMGARRMVAVIAGQNAASLRATEKSGFVTEKVVRVKWLTQDLPVAMPK